MSDIKTLIAAWRASAVPFFRGRAEVLDELESHLWDEVDRRTAAGEAPAVAVQAAIAQLGRVEDLASEFAKVPIVPRPWLPVRLVWVTTMLLTVFTMMMLLPRFSRGGLDSILAGHVAGVMLGYLSCLLVGFLATCFLVARLFREPGPGERATIRSAATWLTAGAVVLTVVGIVLGSYCPFEKRGWCLGLDTREVGGIAIAVWNATILACFWSGRRSGQILPLMVLQVAGSVVVVFGWLGAARVENHNYGYLNSIAALVAFAALSFAMCLTALLPAGSLRPRKA